MWHTCLRRLPRGPLAVSPGVGHAGTIAYAVRKEPIEGIAALVRSINSVCAGSVNALRTPAQET
ncbi:hypothetical protein HaLaN_17397, partial [Haematococcus lacustris]